MTHGIRYPAHVWDDLKFPASGLAIGPTKQPDFAQFRDDGAGSSGVFVQFFDDTIEEQLMGVAQLSHQLARDLGYTLEPHIHWSTTHGNAGNVVWGFEYTLANVGDSFGTTTIDTLTDANAAAYDHLVAGFASISLSGIRESACIFFRIYRKAADAADTMTGDAALIEFDIHEPRIKAGTGTEFPL